jgi:hypothetical protein
MIEPLHLEALRVNEKQLKAKIETLGDTPENADAVARAKTHLSEVQAELRKLAPPKQATPAKTKTK